MPKPKNLHQLLATAYESSEPRRPVLDVANAVGVHRTTVYAWMDGTRRVTIGNVYKFLDAIGRPDLKHRAADLLATPPS